MGTRVITVLGLFTYLLVWCAAPAGAQIVPSVDEHGKRVFVNAEPPAPARATPPSAPVTRTLAARSSTANAPDGLKRLATETAERHELDPALIYLMIETESAWNPRAVSVKGAQGLMQLIPGTAERFGVRDPFDPAQNIEGGVKYMRWLLERYTGDLEKALAAYNAGEGAVDRWGGVPRYAETQTYVKKIVESYFRPGSGRRDMGWKAPRPMYRVVNEKGRVVYTNE